jgi:hypothetical protein
MKARPSRAQRSASQVPGDEAVAADHQVFAVGGTRLKNRFGPGLQMPVEQALSRLVQAAKIHGAGVQGAATRKRVRRGGAAPEGSSAA